MDNFDPYNVLLDITTNIPQRLKTAFVVQGHKYIINVVHNCWYFANADIFYSAIKGY